jgi:hypothetical protein
MGRWCKLHACVNDHQTVCRYYAHMHCMAYAGACCYDGCRYVGQQAVELQAASAAWFGNVMCGSSLVYACCANIRVVTA